jgi:hypothetical protein
MLSDDEEIEQEIYALDLKLAEAISAARLYRSDECDKMLADAIARHVDDKIAMALERLSDQIEQALGARP